MYLTGPFCPYGRHLGSAPLWGAFSLPAIILQLWPSAKSRTSIQTKALLQIRIAKGNAQDGLACAIGDVDLPPLPCSDREEPLLLQFRDGSGCAERNALLGRQMDPRLVTDHLVVRDEVEEKPF
jgi:hypothetical protein